MTAVGIQTTFTARTLPTTLKCGPPSRFTPGTGLPCIISHLGMDIGRCQAWEAKMLSLRAAVDHAHLPRRLSELEEALNCVTALAERQANPEPQKKKPVAIKGNFAAWIQDKRRLKSRVMWHKNESWRLPTSLLALVLTPLLLRFLPVE
jgi:hypothetical protein